MFADTHVHPLMKYVHNDKDPWDPITAGFKLKGLLNLFLGIPAFSQSDLSRMAMGNVQLIFCALHPPEQKIVEHRFRHMRGEPKFEDLASQVISIPRTKLDQYQLATYDHWQQLLVEYDLLLQSEQDSREIVRNGIKKRAQYVICKNVRDVEAILNENRTRPDRHTIAVVPTIEGLHSTGTGASHIQWSIQRCFRHRTYGPIGCRKRINGPGRTCGLGISTHCDQYDTCLQ